jgi:hypothetical protein
MNFLETVKKLYPSLYIRTRTINNSIIYNINDIEELFKTTLNKEGAITLYNHLPGYNDEETYLTEVKLYELLRALNNPITNKIYYEMNKCTLLTNDVLKNQVVSLFDEVFVYDVKVTNDYTIDMYMLKYKIAIELPGKIVDPHIRGKLCKKCDIHCIQLHNESTFNGDLVEANKDFCHAMGVIYKNIK